MHETTVLSCCGFAGKGALHEHFFPPLPQNLRDRNSRWRGAAALEPSFLNRVNKPIETELVA